MFIMRNFKIILFLPKMAKKCRQFYVYGEIEEEEENLMVFYGYDYKKRDTEFGNSDCIVTCMSDLSEDQDDKLTRNYLKLEKTNENHFRVQKAVFKHRDIMEHVMDVLLFYYDEVSFTRKSYKKEDSFFTKLQEKLLKQQNDKKSLSKYWTYAHAATMTVEHQLDRFNYILKYSSIAMHIKTSTERLSWVTEKRTDDSIKMINYFLCILLDIVMGALSLTFVMSFVSTGLFPDLFLLAAENCVNSLRESLQWLMGSPAGFKLNKEFNAMLTKFYLFHTDIWWLFLVYISPILGVAFKVFTFLGWLGLTFQAAILSDILGLVSFHAYCIYAYAARLYNIQLSGLRSLWRLFFGRKWNPLREKVDSCQYSADQLFVGTLVFTILLFLLPTTLIYYVVFTWVRLFLVAIGGVLYRVRLYLHALPLYSLLLWCFGSSMISTQVHIEVEDAMSSESVTVMNVRRVRGPLLPTLRNGIADCVDTLPALLPKGFFRAVLTGELIYPV